MIYEEYIKILKSRFSKHFHINTDVEILGEKVDFQAKFSQVSGKNIRNSKMISSIGMKTTKIVI